MCFAEDWIADGYRFRQNGTSQMPRKNPVMRKVHYQLFLKDIQTTFKKYVYSLISDPEYILIHYTGDDSEAVDIPHGTL